MATQGALFQPTCERPDLPEADLTFIPGFLGPDDADRLFSDLLATSAWRAETIQMYGRQLPVPRLSAWYGERKASYAYSSIRMEPREWTVPLREVKAAVEVQLGIGFNSVLANLYRDGRDSVAWHADDEAELGPEPVIASVSFGETRPFHLRHMTERGLRHTFELTPGSLLVMAGRTQRHWQHQIAKTARPIGPRINLTFRQIHH
jgi:alkylated DNA repair dioxygenase AlkB